MSTNEQRSYAQELGARRFVVGVSQANQSVSKKRGELAARFFNLHAGRRGFEHLGKIGLHLQLGVMVVVYSGCPFGPLRRGEYRAGHLKFTQLSRQRKQRASLLLSVRDSL